MKQEPVELNWSDSRKSNNSYSRRQQRPDNRRNDARNANTNRRDSEFFDGHCTYCQKYGHSEQVCRKKVRDLKLRNATDSQVQPHNSTTNTINASYAKCKPQQQKISVDFPFLDPNQAGSYSIKPTSPLLNTTVRANLFGLGFQSYTALIDSGSTHSFISPRSLNVSQSNFCAKDKRQPLVQKDELHYQWSDWFCQFTVS